MLNNKVVKYKNPTNFNIGVVIFLIIIIYVLYNIFSYFTKPHIAEYQVQQGTIATSYIYQGIIVRDETVEYADQSGYLNYYMKNASKVSVNDVICSIDTVGNIASEISSSKKSEFELSTDSLSTISNQIDKYVSAYNPNSFSESYTFFNNLNSEITHDLNTLALVDLSTMVSDAENANTFYKITSIRPGVISYDIDGFEGCTIEDIISGTVNYNNYNKTHLYVNEKIESGEPLYKRVNSEQWEVIIPITESLANELEGKTSLKIRFCKDDFITSTASSIMQNENAYFLKLSLHKAMVRYINDRFLDIELIMGDDSGLKIPQSAITTKEFFTIPKEYFTIGGDSNKPGLLIKQTINGKDSMALINPTLYYETEKYYYVDSENVSEGDVVLMADSSSSYTIGADKASLIGVYNINKGYAVFKQINIIYENEEYAIIKTKTAYGISLYDHIALNASEIKENQLTSK